MKIKNKIFLSFLIVSILSFFGCDHIHFNYKLKHSEVVEKKISINKDNLVKVDNVNGFIKVSTHDKNCVTVSAKKYSNKKKYLDLIKLYFDSDENGLHIYSKREKKRLKFRVNYTILVPNGLKKLNLHSTNGSIKVMGDLNNLDSNTTNGSIKVNGSFGKGKFRTTNGRVTVVQKNPLNDDLKIKTTNGSIRLTLNRDSNFKIKGRTTNGSISCDFPVKIKKRITSSRINGEVGDGKFYVSVSTTNGSIKINMDQY